MKFELPDKGAHVMNQEMMYTSEGTNYWWNYTGNYQLDDYKGVWKNEDGDGTNTDMYSRFWSSVFARAGKGCEIPNFQGSYLGRFPLVLADFWTSDHLSERPRT